MSTAESSVSVIVVSDYGGRGSGEWTYLRDTLAGLARQDFGEPFEVLLVDAVAEGEEMPAELLGLIPGMRRIRGVGEPSREVLNAAVVAARGELIALLDGDCAPDPAWLRAGVEAMRSHENAAAVSGLTRYPGETFLNRALGALSRSFLDPGGPGTTRFISNNNAIVRRPALLAHPLVKYPRPLAARLQVEAIRMDGGELYFEPRMSVTHRFDGWKMERRIRHNVGYRAIRIRQLDPRIPFSWLVHLGRFSIPVFVAARTCDSWWDCVRAGRHYGLRWYELPAALATAVRVHLLEIEGMQAALEEARADRGEGLAPRGAAHGERSRA